MGKDDKKRNTDVSEGNVKKSISLHMIRHAESGNNQVYRNARYIYRGGTADFDEEGWVSYVNAHRKADPDLSVTGRSQAQNLATYYVPHLSNQASHPVRVLTSPMRRTLQTIRPTLEQLLKEPSTSSSPKCQVKVVAFFHESEGCHNEDTAEEGMNPQEISELLSDCVSDTTQDIDFVGFPDPDRGWYVRGKSAETRSESEARAAKFYLWLCEYLDKELNTPQEDIFDAGVAVPGEENENEHDKLSPRQRRRRTALLIGHGDFMSLVLKRIIAVGHYPEHDGVPHRSAFVHFNTGITELEYFGAGRFLMMCSNQTPHILPNEYATLRSGGSLKDGWSYLMPNDEFILDAEVSVSFSDELEEHVREQSEALKSLYLSSHDSQRLEAQRELTVEKEAARTPNRPKASDVHFFVKQGLHVVGCATLDSKSGEIFDVAIRPSAKTEVAQTLLKSVKDHARRLGRSGSLLVRPRSAASIELFEQLGFQERDSSADTVEMELQHS